MLLIIGHMNDEPNRSRHNVNNYLASTKIYNRTRLGAENAPNVVESSANTLRFGSLVSAWAHNLLRSNTVVFERKGKETTYRVLEENMADPKWTARCTHTVNACQYCTVRITLWERYLLIVRLPLHYCTHLISGVYDLQSMTFHSIRNDV